MSKEERKKRVILSAGGTGGHVMPAQALAKDLLSRGYEVEWVTDKRGERFKDGFGDVTMHVLPSGTLGAGLMGKLKGVAALALGILKAQTLIKRRQPDLVVGFGGYPSFPAVYAAQSLGVPTILHEQNAIIGKANHMLAPKALRIASSVPQLKGLEKAEAVNCVFTGNPVRSEITALYTKPYPALEASGPLRILVMGGSLGAKVFSDILPEALARLPSDHRARLHIVQQCRAEYLDEARKTYGEAGIKAELKPFIDDVPEQLEAAHVVIARSGASTVAEVTAAGRPAVFVPYPHHKDQQQKQNADVIADAGGAWVMTENGFTPEAVLARIETFLQNPETLFRAAEKARECGRPDAARKLGNLITAVISGWNE